MASLLDLSTYLDGLSAKIEPQFQDLRTAADNQVDRIRSRTASGVGIDGTSFAGYRPKTKKTGTVNLRDTGNMLDSIQVSATNNEARIGFSDPRAAEVAGYNNAGTRKQASRTFFGLSLQDRTDILADIRTSVFRRVNS